MRHAQCLAVQLTLAASTPACRCGLQSGRWLSSFPLLSSAAAGVRRLRASFSCQSYSMRVRMAWTLLGPVQHMER